MLMFGKVPLEFTATEADAVHPFAGSVAVTVYVPELLTVEGFVAFTNEPPFQTNVEPADVPVSETEGTEQVIDPLLTAVTVGAIVSDKTITVDVAVHPFAGFVAVTVYVPAAETLAGLAAFTNAPPFQTSVAPTDVPVNVAVNAEHEMELLPAEETVGAEPTVIVTVEETVPFDH